MSVGSNSNIDGLAAIVRPHIDKEFPLNEEVKQVDEVKYGEFRRPTPFNGSSGAKFRVGPPGYYMRKTLAGKVETKVAQIEECKTIFANDRTPLYTPLYYSPEEIKYFSSNLDDTKCIPKGIVKNLLIKIDKFILLVDFVILDMIEDFKMPVILGRPLLAMTHAKVDIFQRTISLEVGNEKVIFKMRSNFSNSINEYVQMIKTKMNTEDDELMKIDSGLFTYNTNSCKINHLLSIDPDMFTFDIEVQESYEETVYKCSLIAQETNGGLRFGKVNKTTRDKILQDHWRKRFENEYDDNEEFEDPDGCKENKEIEILGTIFKKLHDEWFKGTDEDDVDLEGIIDYLEPTLYGRFVDSDDDEYKERKCRLLRMPYIKPPLILIEKVYVTRYSIGPGEVYTKIKISRVEELSRTKGNIASIRAGIMDEIYRNDDNEESHDEM
uniref:Reverse transcriptase domain-containing protein n=1 Tax=Tanacetum cinerariifolium TaxID=118510 RepID=A0A699GTC0_TANCI|nr:hypothetical protein [Tanacetum cinerariifolium]